MKVNKNIKIKFYNIYFLIIIIYFYKLVLIYFFGSNIPYWDQWDAEAWYLYKPYIEGKLRLSDLFSAHNEHRIFFSRIIFLTIYEITNGWYPILQMMINGLIHIFALIIFTGLITNNQKEIKQLIFFLLILYIFPFSYGNTLFGFQSQFYLVILFSLISLNILLKESINIRKEIIGFGLIILTFFTSASGVLTTLSLIPGKILAYYKSRKKYKLYYTVVFLLLIFLIQLQFIPSIEGHKFLKSKNILILELI